MPISAQLRSICPRAPNTWRASQLVVEPHSASSAASGPKLPPESAPCSDLATNHSVWMDSDRRLEVARPAWG